MEITAAIIQDFRNSLPAFADTTKYTDTQVKEFLCNADAKTANGWGLYKTCDEQHPPPPKRWGMFYLFPCHFHRNLMSFSYWFSCFAL